MPLILAIETSAHVGAVALCGEGVALSERVLDCDIKLSGWVLPAVERLLSRHGGGDAGISAVAWGAGPGAFTGVRTACATAQALAYAWRKPLLSVDSLAALAAASGANEVIVAMDARMDQAYIASFRRDSQGELVRTGATQLSDPASVVVPAGWSLIGSGTHLVPAANRADPALTALAEANWAHGVAAIAAGMLSRGQTTDPTHAEPIYVRNKVALTEAERAAGRSQVAMAAPA